MQKQMWDGKETTLEREVTDGKLIAVRKSLLASFIFTACQQRQFGVVLCFHFCQNALLTKLKRAQTVFVSCTYRRIHFNAAFLFRSIFFKHDASLDSCSLNDKKKNSAACRGVTLLVFVSVEVYDGRRGGGEDIREGGMSPWMPAGSEDARLSSMSQK